MKQRVSKKKAIKDRKKRRNQNMNLYDIVLQSSSLILDENYTIKKCAKKFNIKKSVLRTQLLKLNNEELTNKITGNSQVEEDDDEEIQLVLDTDSDMQFVVAEPKKNSDEHSHHNNTYVSKIKPLAVLKYRAKHKYTQIKFSQLCNIGASSVSNIETGFTPISELCERKILQGLHITVDELNKYADMDIPIKELKKVSKVDFLNEQVCEKNTEESKEKEVDYEDMYFNLKAKYEADLKSNNGNISKWRNDYFETNKEKDRLARENLKLADDNDIMQKDITFLKAQIKEKNERIELLEKQLEKELETTKFASGVSEEEYLRVVKELEREKTIVNKILGV